MPLSSLLQRASSYKSPLLLLVVFALPRRKTGRKAAGIELERLVSSSTKGSARHEGLFHDSGKSGLSQVVSAIGMPGAVGVAEGQPPLTIAYP